MLDPKYEIPTRPSVHAPQCGQCERRDGALRCSRPTRRGIHLPTGASSGLCGTARRVTMGMGQPRQRGNAGSAATAERWRTGDGRGATARARRTRRCISARTAVRHRGLRHSGVTKAAQQPLLRRAGWRGPVARSTAGRRRRMAEGGGGPAFRSCHAPRRGPLPASCDTEGVNNKVKIHDFVAFISAEFELRGAPLPPKTTCEQEPPKKARLPELGSNKCERKLSQGPAILT